jgi:hypothetical protein
MLALLSALSLLKIPSESELVRVAVNIIPTSMSRSELQSGSATVVA